MNRFSLTFHPALLAATILIVGLCFAPKSVLAESAKSVPQLLAEEDPFLGADEVLHFSFEEDPSRPYDGDRDLDGMPDDWWRRKGPNFPQYVTCGIDRTTGKLPENASNTHGAQSFRVDLNGGDFVVYSPFNKVARVNPIYSYVFEGWVRTENLHHSAAMISISLLNSKRQRVQQYLSKPITGTFADWVPVQISPILPREDVSFVIIGLHLVNQRTKDIRGKVWFDGLRLGKKPRLSSNNDFYSHFKDARQSAYKNIDVNFKISGLNYKHNNILKLTLTNSADEIIEQDTKKIEAPKEEELDDDSKSKEITWKLDAQKISIGYYQVHAELLRNQHSIASQNSSFAVMNIVSHKDKDFSLKGEFGWSINSELQANVLSDLGEITSQAGINWMKYPVWKHSFQSDQSHTIALFKDVSSKGITPVGVLHSPPPFLRKQFKLDWSGVREVFNMSRKFWSRSLEPVVAHFSSTVQHWQLGSDEDLSFVGENGLNETVSSVKKHFDIVGRNTKIGVRWTWKSALPTNIIPSHAFLLVKDEEPTEAELAKIAKSKTTPDERLYEKLTTANNSDNRIPLWVLIKPLDKSYPKEERGADLVKRMVAAKRGGADQIHAMNIFSKDYGLMMESGSPTLLFLPWRTTALALRNTKFIGSFKLTNGSTNYLFERNDKVVMVIWNDNEDVEERLFLGDFQRVKVYNVWGQQIKNIEVDAEKSHVLPVGRTPLIIRNCSAGSAKWRLMVKYEKGQAPSQSGKHQDALILENTFSQGISVNYTLKMPSSDWNVEPEKRTLSLAVGEKKRFPFSLTLPTNVSIGTHDTMVDFIVEADSYPYHVSVTRPYQVGLGEVDLEVVDVKEIDGRLQIKQVIRNNTNPEEVLNFNCNLYIPGMRRQHKHVVKLTPGNIDTKFYFLENAEKWKGVNFRIKADQEGGRRVLNKTWTVGENWEEEVLDKNVKAQPQRQGSEINIKSKTQP